MIKKLLLAGAAMMFGINVASAKELTSIGLSIASMGNPYFVALSKGVADEAKKINPNAKVTTVAYNYDLGKEFNDIDDFIASGVDVILISADDAKAIAPAIKKAEAAGIVVVAVDSAADGVDATVMTDNVQAGATSCQAMVDEMGPSGNVIIVNGPQISAVIDRVKGCESVLSKYPGIKILSSDQDGKGSRDVGFSVAQSLLTRFDNVNGIFCINDPEAIGTALAAKQMGRTNFIITGIDGSPDMASALQDPAMSQIWASATQAPYVMGQNGVKLGLMLLNGQKPATTLTLMPSVLVTRSTIASYKGWNPSTT